MAAARENGKGASEVYDKYAFVFVVVNDESAAGLDVIIGACFFRGAYSFEI